MSIWSYWYRKCILSCLRYLKCVVSVHSEMRAVRLARQLRQKRLSRLEVGYEMEVVEEEEGKVVEEQVY